MTTSIQGLTPSNSIPVLSDYQLTHMRLLANQEHARIYPKVVPDGVQAPYRDQVQTAIDELQELKELGLLEDVRGHDIPDDIQILMASKKGFTLFHDSANNSRSIQ